MLSLAFLKSRILRKAVTMVLPVKKTLCSLKGDWNFNATIWTITIPNKSGYQHEKEVRSKRYGPCLSSADTYDLCFTGKLCRRIFRAGCGSRTFLRYRRIRQAE